MASRQSQGNPELDILNHRPSLTAPRVAVLRTGQILVTAEGEASNCSAICKERH
jgi:hypothetical protein